MKTSITNILIFPSTAEGQEYSGRKIKLEDLNLECYRSAYFENREKCNEFWETERAIDALNSISGVFREICQSGGCSMTPEVCSICRSIFSYSLSQGCFECGEMIESSCYGCEFVTMKSFSCNSCAEQFIHSRCTPNGEWSEEAYDNWECKHCVDYANEKLRLSGG
jgi:hypothetical protein